MRTICLYFEIHQIIHLKRYRFFDIGADHYYYDDYANENGMNEVAERSYIPALSTLRWRRIPMEHLRWHCLSRGLRLSSLKFMRQL